MNDMGYLALTIDSKDFLVGFDGLSWFIMERDLCDVTDLNFVRCHYLKEKDIYAIVRSCRENPSYWLKEIGYIGCVESADVMTDEDLCIWLGHVVFA